jgi:hypothetical protein
MQVINPIYNFRVDRGTGVGLEMISSQILVKNCIDDILPNNPAVICDYFGMFNTSKLKMDIIFGVYQEMVLYEQITAKILHNALLMNKLNRLIHTTLIRSESQYYKDFKALGIKVGTNLNGNESDD